MGGSERASTRRAGRGLSRRLILPGVVVGLTLALAVWQWGAADPAAGGGVFATPSHN
jgi:hypothetical protein